MTEVEAIQQLTEVVRVVGVWLFIALIINGMMS